MPRNKSDPECPLCLPVNQWPGVDLAAWTEAVDRVDLFGPRSASSSWSERSRVKTAKGYGRWLSWATENGIDMNLCPADRVTREHVQRYVADLRSRNGDFTVLCRLQELYDSMRVMAPDRDWSWLWRAQNVLRSRCIPVRDKASRIKPVGALVRLGKSLMRDAAKVPHLRIIGEELWNRVKARQQRIRFTISRDEQGNALNRAHRRRFLLSGLLVCGDCGGGYTIVGLDRYGCATRRSKGTCSNTFTIRRQEIEERVFAGLRERMMAPELVAAFVDEFNAELPRLAGDATAERDAARRMLAAADRKIFGIVKAIEDGAYSSALKDRLALLERQKAEAAARLAAVKTQPVMRLHPNLSRLYKAKLEQLGTALNDPGIAAEVGDVMRDLIDRVVLTPVDGALKIELYGDLATLMAFAEGTERKTNDPGPSRSGSLLSVVAGCNQRCLQTLRVRVPTLARFPAAASLGTRISH